MVSSEGLPLRSDNAADCQFLLLKTPLSPDGSRYTLVHMWARDLGLNLTGHRLEDVLEMVNDQTKAIFITGSRNHLITATARDLKFGGGVTTIKHIEVPSEDEYVSLVYKPGTNECLVKLGNIDEAKEVLVFEGF